MKKLLLMTSCIVACSVAVAQKTWTVDDCISYAINHNHEVAQRRLSLDNSRADKLSAIGAFLPSIGIDAGAQYNFGRAINPETNTYTDVSTFYNSYSAQASLPIFDGMQRIHQLKAAKAGVLLGKTRLEISRDEVALQVFQTYIDALYYQGTTGMAEAKLRQSEELLRQTRAMAEVGLKSEADVAQIEAQVATDEYEVTRQGNLKTTAILELQEKMGVSHPYPLPKGQGSFNDTLDCDFKLTIEGIDTSKTIESFPSPFRERAGVRAAHLSVTIAEHQLGIARSHFLPSLSLNAGVSTTFFKTLGSESIAFKEQLKNNAGEYIGVSLSIPIFNRLSTVANYRRQRNNLAIAREELAQKSDELDKLCLQAETDCIGYAKEVAQMEKKVCADSLALQITTRQYEEGLSSPIDVQTTAATLLQSRASLLRCQLMLALKRKLKEYYNGISI